MRVLWITQRWGGHQRWRLGDLRGVVAELLNRGHDVRILTREKAADYPFADRVEVMPHEGSRLQGRDIVRFVRWAQERVSEGGFDVSVSLTSLVSADVMLLTESLWSVGIRRWGKIKHRWSPWIRQLLGIESEALDRQRAGRLLVFDDDLWHQVASSAHGPSAPGGVVVPPLDMGLPEGLDAESCRERVRRGLGIDDRERVVVCASLRPSDDEVDKVLLAHAGLVRSGYRVTLLLATWVGYRMNEKIARLGARSSVKLVGTPERLTGLLEAADLVVHPASDGGGEVLMPMGLCVGCPMVVSDRAGGVDRLTESDSGGHVLSFGSPSASWAGAIRGVQESDTGPRVRRDDLIRAFGVRAAADDVETQLLDPKGLRSQV